MQSIIPIEYKNTIPNIGDVNITGFSRSGFRTGFVMKINGFTIYLDAGLSSSFIPDLILLTHGHLDHTSSLPAILSQNIKCPIMHPKSLSHNLLLAVKSFYCLNNDILDKKHFSINSIIKTHAQFKKGQKQIAIETFDLDHGVSCQGYKIYVEKQKLKDEYIGKSGEELKEIKKTEEITKVVKQPSVIFCCDTSSRVLSSLDYSFPIIIIECTFLLDEHYEEAISRLHIHWKDLEPYIYSNKTTNFCLIHFSTRYKNEQLIEFEKQVQKSYSNVEFWI